MIRGLTYVFSVNASGHPFWIQTSDGGYNSSNVYNTGITNNGTQSGNIRWVVDNTTPSTLFYVCEYHSSMQGQINIVDLSFAPFTYVNNSLNSYYTKTVIDSSLNDNFYNKTSTESTFLAKSAFDSSMNSNYSTKAATDLSINNVLGSYALSSSLDSYYLKADTDLSINSLLGSYSTTDYVDDRFTTLVGTISTETLDTLAEIANALQGDASFGLTVYGRINSCDSSINTIRTSLSGYATKTAVDASLALYSTKSFIDASLALYSTKSVIDASLALYSTKSVIDASLALYSTKSFIDASLALYSTKSLIDNSLSLYVLTSALTNTGSLQSGSTSDVSLNGNVQLGGGSKFIGINKTPNPLYSLDVSGSAYITNNLDMSGSINAYGIFNNGEVFDSGMDGLSTNMYTNFFTSESISQSFAGGTASAPLLAMSNDGKYVLCTPYSGASPALLSTNYGVTFTDISNSLLNAGGNNSARFAPAVSATGKYMFSPGNPAVSSAYYSTNYGATWVRDSAAPGMMYALSYSGKYVVKCISGTSNNIQFSSNYGTTYTAVFTGSSQPYPYFAAMSGTGQVIATCSHIASGVKISKNFGKTWTALSTVGNTFFVAMSASGRYIMAGGNLSTDFGDTFTQPAGLPTSYITGLSVSATGQYMIITNASTSFYSVDYGKTWSNRGTNGTNGTNGTSVAMTANASFVMQATTTGIYKYTSLSEVNASSAYIANNVSINKTLNALYSLDVSGSVYVSNNLDMSGSINAYGIFNNGEVFDSGMDGLSTNMYTNFFTSESRSRSYAGLGSPTISMSNDGKYILSFYYTGEAFLSTNYGVSFTDISNSTGNQGNRFPVSVSATGKYMFSPGNSTQSYYSTDYGATWAIDPNSGRMAAMSYSGKYIVKCPPDSVYTIKLSSNYGATYTTVNVGSSLPIAKNAAISATGQIIALVSTLSSGVKISKNFGKTWTLLSTSGTPFSVAMSSSGRYILAGGNLSTDFGDTFTYQDGLPTTSITGTSVSANGQYMIVTNVGTGYYSVDYGKTWSTRFTNGSNTTNGTCVAMTANASFVIQATTTGIYKYTSFSAINASSLDISGSTNMSGNLALTKAPSSTMGSFDLSAVNMSVFNVSEKFTNVTLSATPTLDYSTGGIFYMPGVNAALTSISITNVPTTLNRSISVTLILAQTGGSGTFCFTTGTLNINGTSVTYLKPDATALAAPSAARSIIINQFIIIWASATPTVIAYLSSMGV